MIAEERTTAYINSLDRGNTDLLNEIEEEAKRARVPVIRREMQSFLKTLLAAKQPRAVLEVGTAVGFSALLLCEYGHPEAHITTIEKDEKRISAARENFRRAGKEGQITLLEGEADEHLGKLSGPFDLIFMDGAKGQYLHFLPQVLRLLAAGGLLVSDNVLQEGDLIESRFAVERRNRTIHSRMREYLYELTHHPGLVTSILPLGDGVALSVKKEDL